ncbi:efflux RND transporter periplasmic adaptor subunit [Massilia sp. PWRC2]|uniref:efflux RND transporter periplasmic adaptor subunit n=1 Tax=Massilia sp. PWRC2 TaxID=2804626 RepID=UPI003CE79DA6
MSLVLPTVTPSTAPAGETAARQAARHPWRRRGPLLGVAIVIALSAGVVLAQVMQQPATPALPARATPVAAAVAAPAPVKADLVAVQRGTLQASVDAAGKLQLYKFVDVSAQIAGQVKDVLVAVGDNVKAGTLLVDIVPTVQPTKVESQRAQMARLQAELADQRAQLDYAELQLKRQTQLKAQNATREDAFESSRMGVTSASARVDSINAQIRQLEANQKIDEDSRQHAQVLASMDGTVVAINVHPGQPVGPGSNQLALLRIADQSKMTVQARVAEIDVTRLRKGMTASFSTPGYPGQRWSGKLRQVMPIPADGTGEQGKETFYNVVFDVANPDQQLMSGMSAQVRFAVGQAEDTVVLAARALGVPDADGVYSVQVRDANGQFSGHRVRTGLRNREQVQVLAGLAVGEQVLVGKLPPMPMPMPAPGVARPAAVAAVGAGAASAL